MYVCMYVCIIDTDCAPHNAHQLGLYQFEYWTWLLKLACPTSSIMNENNPSFISNEQVKTKRKYGDLGWARNLLSRRTDASKAMCMYFHSCHSLLSETIHRIRGITVIIHTHTYIYIYILIVPYRTPIVLCHIFNLCIILSIHSSMFTPSSFDLFHPCIALYRD